MVLRFMLLVGVFCAAPILAVPVAQGDDDVSKTITATNVIYPAPDDNTNQQTATFDDRCCKLGRRAARRGYSCEVYVAILQGRLNMPHRYKMKFEGKSPKTGFDFARKFSQCTKTTKHSDQFYRCCKKNAAKMDGDK